MKAPAAGIIPLTLNVASFVRRDSLLSRFSHQSMQAAKEAGRVRSEGKEPQRQAWEVAVEASASLTESEIFGRLTKRSQRYMLTLDRNLAAAN